MGGGQLPHGRSYGAANRFFDALSSAVEPETGCIIWPFARNSAGYAVFGSRRGSVRSSLVSRVMCAIANGNPMDPSLEAAHLCGNGSRGCINPAHLAWKTSKENSEDTIRHGKSNKGDVNGQAKLCASDVIRIRDLSKKHTQKEIARLFNINKSTVSLIVNRKRWDHI